MILSAIWSKQARVIFFVVFEKINGYLFISNSTEKNHGITC